LVLLLLLSSSSSSRDNSSGVGGRRESGIDAFSSAHTYIYGPGVIIITLLVGSGSTQNIVSFIHSKTFSSLRKKREKSNNMDVPFWYILLVLYLSISWLVFLGGIASSQSNCSGTIAFQSSNKTTAESFDSTFGTYSCSNAFGLSWWVCFYQLIVMCMAVVCSVKDQLATHKVALVGILAPLTALMMQQGNSFLKLSEEMNSSATNTAAAGAILLSMGNLVLTYYIGLEDSGVVLAKQFFPERTMPTTTTMSSR